MNNTSSIRVATVGTGYFSRFQYAAWDRISEVELVAICNRSRQSALEVAEQYSIGQIYEDFELMLDEVQPDLIDIITPPNTHYAYVDACSRRGIAAICQKPFTSSLEEAEKLEALIEARNAKVIIHENFRFQPWYGKIKKILDEGKLGQLYQISFALRPGDGQGPSAYLDRQPYFQQMDRFLVHETAVHLIDVFRYLFGEITSTYADLRRINPVINGEDAALLIFNFENGARGMFDGNRLGDHKATNRRLTMGEMQLEGENGVLLLNGDAELFWRENGKNEAQKIEYKWQNNDFGGDCVYNLQRHVVDNLLYGRDLMNTSKDYITNLKIVNSAYESNRTSKAINH